ncbi:MAG: methyl-accepting chemotaxis protein [Kineosporiaceae bacterium]
MHRLRRWTMASRIVALLLLLSTGLVSVAAVAISSQRAATASQERFSTVADLARDAADLRYRFADLNGWQTAYALDVALQGPDGARDASPSRKAFLASVSTAQRDLDAVTRAGQSVIDAEELALLTRARTTLDTFMQVDRDIVAKYLTGKAADKRAADGLVLGREIELFESAAADLQSFAGHMRERQDENKAAAAAAGRRAGLLTIVVTVTVLLLAGLGSVIIVRSIRRPLDHLRARLDDIATGDGDLTQRLDEHGRDEVTQIAVLFNTFVADIAGTVRQVKDASTTLAAAAEELSATSTAIAREGELTRDRAASVAGASEQITTSVQEISLNANQMGQSIGEIARSASEVSQVASTAVDMADRTTSTVQQLGESSQAISSVLALINAVAGQTNLLALNATIEAARAGEAGKGFAVVADEVKQLAQETARATEDIARRIEQIQRESSQAVEAITEIGQVIAQISDHQTSIAGAVEQQTANASGMGRAVEEVAAGSQSISASIGRVAESAGIATINVNESLRATQELAVMGSQLHQLVSRFTV